VTAEEKSNYTRIIDGILRAADLQTVTRKKIRQGLEAAVDKDLSDQKVCCHTPWCCCAAGMCFADWWFCPIQDAIKNLIEARFDAVSSKATQAIPTPPSGTTGDLSPKHEYDGTSPSDDTGADIKTENIKAENDGEIEVSLQQPAKKKQKRESSSEDADARLAAELQAQENRLSRGPRTRGGVTAKPTKPAKGKAKKPKKKSEKRARSEDDSDAEGSDVNGKPKRKAGGGFQKPFNLSYALQEVCGEPQVSPAMELHIASWCVLTCLLVVSTTSGQETMGVYQR